MNERARYTGEERVHRLSAVILLATLPILAVAFFFVGGLFWLIGLIPLLLLLGLMQGAARWSGELLRRTVAAPVFVGAWLWQVMLPTSIALLFLALLICALPRRAWRKHILGPLALGTLALAVSHPQFEWQLPGFDAAFIGHWLMMIHVATLTTLVLLFAFIDVGDLPTKADP